MYHRRALVATILALALIAAACGSGSPGGEAEARTGDVARRAAIETETPSWLFVIEAASGTATGDTLTLADVGAQVVAFSDRPTRAARIVGTADLVDSWAEYGFADDPPNAALTAVADGVERTTVVTLADPTWDGDRATLTFTFDVVADRPDSLAGVGGPHEEPAPSFERAVLFVDASAPVGNRPVQGRATITDISEAEYESLSNQAQRASSAPCVTAAVTVCTLVTGSSDDARWTVFAEAGEGVSTDGSAAKLTVQAGSDIKAVASPPVDWKDSRWVQIVWDSPTIGVPSAGIDLDAVVQIGTDNFTIARCPVEPAGNDLTYHCSRG